MSDNVTPRDLLDRALDELSDNATDLEEWRADLAFVGGAEEREMFEGAMRSHKIKVAFLYKLYDLLEEMENY